MRPIPHSPTRAGGLQTVAMMLVTHAIVQCQNYIYRFVNDMSKHNESTGHRSTEAFDDGRRWQSCDVTTGQFDVLRITGTY